MWHWVSRVCRWLRPEPGVIICFGWNWYLCENEDILKRSDMMCVSFSDINCDRFKTHVFVVVVVFLFLFWSQMTFHTEKRTQEEGGMVSLYKRNIYSLCM